MFHWTSLSMFVNDRSQFKRDWPIDLFALLVCKCLFINGFSMYACSCKWNVPWTHLRLGLQTSVRESNNVLYHAFICLLVFERPFVYMFIHILDCTMQLFVGSFPNDRLLMHYQCVAKFTCKQLFMIVSCVCARMVRIKSSTSWFVCICFKLKKSLCFQ